MFPKDNEKQSTAAFGQSPRNDFNFQLIISGVSVVVVNWWPS